MKTIRFSRVSSYDRPNTLAALDARMAVANATIAACNERIRKSCREVVILSKITIAASTLTVLICLVRWLGQG